jgi:sodium/potassium-transporting ATPase subunit beta
MAADDVDFAGKGQKKGFGAKVRGCCNSIWNPQKKELLGRTGSSWAKIGLFYIVFYSCLAGFFAIMLVGFFSTLDERSPTMTHMYSLIKQNPGMGYRPMIETESTLIHFNTSKADTYKGHVKNILDFLIENKYITDQLEQNTEHAVDGDGKPLFNFTEFSTAGCGIDKGDRDNSFGYKEGKPCVLLKLNRVFDWTPHPFDSAEALDSEVGKEAQHVLGDRMTNTSIGVSCEGENDGDIDNLGQVEFYPNDGFPFQYYPYRNAQFYRAPLVFVKFPNVQPGVVIQVWCKLWEKNIKHHKNDKGGSVHFELLVDKERTVPPSN